MPELTEVKTLGVGLAFLSNWDFRVKSGSIDRMEGVELLGRDIAFSLQGYMEEVRGEHLDPNTREDIRIRINRVLRREDRISSHSITGIEESDENGNIEVSVEIEAITGEQGEFILTPEGGQ